MKNKSNKIRILNLSDVIQTGCKQFNYIDQNGLVIEAFVIRTSGKIVAYKNACPHLNVELNWNPDKFLNLDNSFIICATHGALFRIEDGLCVQGPCIREKLHSLTINVSGEDIYLVEMTG